MATLISKATGNFTSSSTWGVASAVAGAELDSDASSINLSTGNSDSGTFIPAVTNIDAVAIKLGAVITPTGTVTVKLRNSTTGADVATVTVNASDLNLSAAGWHVFSFAAHTPNGTDSYLIRVTRSVADSAGNRIPLSASTASATNMSREVRLITTAAPGANDKLIVAGEFTGVASSNSYTVTMDNADAGATSFGPTVSGGPPQGLTVNNKAILKYGTAASTAYYLKLKGLLLVYGGGELDMGTSGTPMPASSSAVLEFASVANVDSGLRIANGGIFEGRGNAIANTKAFLNADAAASATSLTTDISTGWKSGDKIAIASTTRTASQTESVLLTADASGTTLTVGALVNAHSGSGATKAEIINVTRNVVLRGITTSLQGYVLVNAVATFTANYVEFSQLGSATSSKRGMDIFTLTGTCTVQNCALHDFIVSSSIGFNIVPLVNSNANITYSNNVSWNIQSAHLIGQSTDLPSSISITSNVFLKNSSGTMITLSPFSTSGYIFTGNTIVGSSGSGVSLSRNGTISGLVAHSNNGNGISFSSTESGAILSSMTLWRNTSPGLSISNITGKLLVDTLTAFGNGTANIEFSGSGTFSSLVEARLASLTLNSDASFSTSSGLVFPTNNRIERVVVDSSSFGASVNHANDINMNTSLRVGLVLRNTTLSSPSQIGSIGSLLTGSYICKEKDGGVSNAHSSQIVGVSTYTLDTSVYDITPSLKITSGESCRFRAAVANGQALTLSVKVRKSVIGDGVAYVGDQLRLMVAANPALGINSDTILATSTNAANGAFETISGLTATVNDNGVLEFFVTGLNRTAGFFNIDTLLVT